MTHIIHNGWQVNLNSSISDFGPNLLSVRKLVDFCLRSRGHPGRPAKLVFISTNGVVRSEWLKPVSYSIFMAQNELLSAF